MSHTSAQTRFEAGQGSFLPPEQMGLGPQAPVTQEAPEAYFKTVLSPEAAQRVAALTYEGKALKNFASECEADGSKTDVQNRLEGVEDFEEPERKLVDRQETAEATLERMALAAKTNFALSIGIQPETKVTTDPETGEIIHTAVHAQKASEHRRLNTMFKEFSAQYRGVRNATLRDARRKAIQHEIASIYATAAGAK